MLPSPSPMVKQFAYDDSVLCSYRRQCLLKPMHSTPSSPMESIGSMQLCSETENGGEEKHKKAGKPFNEQLQPLNIDAELFQTRKKSPLVRSKTFDTNVSQISSECETKLERKKSSTSQFTKTNAQFHKLFKEVCKDELLKQSYTCALQKDILYQGKLFVSENWICFHSKVFGKDTRIVIPVSSVTLIKKTKTAILVPNALVIATPNDRHVFGSLLSRDATYKVLKSICVHLEDKSTGNSPVVSAENSFRAERPTSLPLDFAADFSDLDGAVRKRRQEMEETTSSGSQTPEYESIPEFPGVPPTFLNVVKNGDLPVHADIHMQQNPERNMSVHRKGSSRLVGVVHKVKSLRPISLNALLLVYLVLVCVLVLSSCYMGFKIMALEQRLTSLGSLTEYRENELFVQRRSESNVNAEMIHGELTSNLAKLEQIKKNLQRLLDETE
ncbi:GRAM domain-containing protein 2B-like isoform X1 [Acipenser ruthenus]|uniref:GRAM domain-containing protein 2B-like isoform X1 n=1 Tax=Acipenser ruthenus TaxID=7906 RepID=UPI0027413285|nr:GRAM domain-containing protein 2B-like isoform X1 [Acipenser ruthenus]